MRGDQVPLVIKRQKIVLWRGNMLKLEVDAIVNSSNEALSDRTGLAAQVRTFHFCSDMC
jgi:O-acetyl-ADP-ribose deacetylase (regulator of RNase III)